MWKGVARNPCGRLNAFFYMSKDFVSAFLTEKMGHLLRKTSSHVPRHCLRKIHRTIWINVCPLTRRGKHGSPKVENPLLHIYCSIKSLC